MKLIRNGAFEADNFTEVADDAPLPEGGAIVSLDRFRKDGENLFAHNRPLGVRLKPDQSPENLGPDAQRLSLVVLEFEKFRDGRPFSWARLLRTRLGFRGEIRAAGDYLYDQIEFMRRTGFDAFEVPDAFTLAQYETALTEITDVYQPSADGRKTIYDLRTTRK